MTGLLLMLSLSAPHDFGAPLPEDAGFVRSVAEKDIHGREISLSIHKTATGFESVKKFYRRTLKGQRSIRLTERSEARDPAYLRDPSSPKSLVPVLQAQNMNFGSSWSTIFVRPYGAETLIAVRQRLPAPRVNASPPQSVLVIPRAVLQFETMNGLETLAPTQPQR